MRVLLDQRILLSVSAVVSEQRPDPHFSAGAIIFTIIAVLSVLSYYGFRSRIPLASLLLQVVMDVAKHHFSVYAVAFTALIVQAALAV
jgi:hypothetical protein